MRHIDIDPVMTDLVNTSEQLTILEVILTTHVNCVSNLSFTILDRQSSTARRKLSEALMISRHEPKLNAREELVETMKFMLH